MQKHLTFRLKYWDMVKDSYMKIIHLESNSITLRFANGDRLPTEISRLLNNYEINV